MAPIVLPKPSGAFFRDEEFGLPIYLLVGFLAFLLVVASNIALTPQVPHLYGHMPSSNLPSDFLSHSKYCYLFQLSLSMCVFANPLSIRLIFSFIVSP